MSEWKEYKLGEVVAFGNGKVRPTIIGEIPVYGGNGILDYCNIHNYLGETIIIGRVGAYCGSVYYENKPIWISDNALAAKPKNGYNAKFLYYYLTNLRLNEFAEGSSHPLVTQTLLNSIDVRITNDIEEQERIAGILSSLDDKIDLLTRQNRTLEAMAETLFRQYFIKEINEDWDETILSEHTQVHRGLSYKGNGLTDIYSGLPMHNLNSIYEGGGYKTEGIKFYSGEFKERHLVSSGDIIIANTEQGHEYKLIGYPAVVPEYFGKKGIFSQHIYKITTNAKTYLTNQFLYYLLKTPILREQIISATNGSTVNMLAIDGLQRPTFKLPPEEKVDSFSSIIKDYWTKKSNNVKQMRSLIKLRDTLLLKLMNNEI